MKKCVMKYLPIVLLFFCFYSFSIGQTEADYINHIQNELGGEQEVSVYGGRVDLVTDEYAYEVEWANKWKNAIGQSIWYSLQTNKKPGIIIIQETPSEFKYVQQLFSALDHANLSSQIKVLVFPTDFESHELITKKMTSQYWLSKNSKKRHNSTCRWFEKSVGDYCNPSDGTAAGCCGG